MIIESGEKVPFENKRIADEIIDNGLIAYKKIITKQRADVSKSLINFFTRKIIDRILGITGMEISDGAKYSSAFITWSMIKKISTSSMPRTFVNACLVRNCSIIIEKTSTMQSQTIALTTANVVRV